MVQIHRFQQGVFHVTTNAQDREPWCVFRSTPEIIIGNLLLTAQMHEARVYAFCILPDHLHLIVRPGKRGLSKFVQSFKTNSSREIWEYRQEPSSRVGRNDDPGIVVPAGIPTRGVFHGWQRGFYDELIRDVDQFNLTCRYVEENAQRHRLIHSAQDWPWTSIHFDQVID